MGVKGGRRKNEGDTFYHLTIFSLTYSKTFAPSIISSTFLFTAQPCYEQTSSVSAPNWHSVAACFHHRHCLPGGFQLLGDVEGMAF